MKSSALRKNIMHNTRKRQIKNLIFIWGMLLLPILHFVVFWVYINLNTILMSFKTYQGAGNYVWSLDNFRRIFEEFALPDSVLTEALINTLKFFPVNMLTIFLSLVFSYWLYKKIPLAKFYKVVFFLPSIIAPTVLASLFVHALDPHGPINLICEKVFGMDFEDIPYWLTDTRYAMNSVIMYTFWTSFGLNVILFSGAMERVPKDILEYARIDGISMFKELWLILFPLIWSTISIILITSFAGVFNATGATLILTNGAYKTMTIQVLIFRNVTVLSYEYPSAIGLFFTLIGLPIALISRKIFERIYSEVAY